MSELELRRRGYPIVEARDLLVVALFEKARIWCAWDI